MAGKTSGMVLERHTYKPFNSRRGMFLMSDFIKMTHILIKCTVSYSWVFPALSYIFLLTHVRNWLEYVLHVAALALPFFCEIALNTVH